MATINIDHTGQTYGNVIVLKRSEKGWKIQRICCGTIEDVTSKRLNDLIRMPVIRCRDCLSTRPKSTAAQKARANRARKKDEEKKKEPTVFDKTPGYWPFLGKMGFRHQ